MDYSKIIEELQKKELNINKLYIGFLVQDSGYELEEGLNAVIDRVYAIYLDESEVSNLDRLVYIVLDNWNESDEVIIERYFEGV